MLTKDEQLATLEALSKRIKPILDDLKSDVRNELLEACKENGVDRKAILVDGQKVGEVGISYSTAKAAIYPGREKEAIEYLTELGLTEVVPIKGWEKSFTRVGNEVANKDTGEILDFLYWEPSVAKSASVRGCKPDDVIQAMQGKLNGETIMGLLEG